MDDKRKKGLYAVGIGLTVVGIGIIYFSFTLSRAIVTIPEVLEIARTTQQEAAEYRDVIDEFLEEVEAVRLAIPDYLVQAGELSESFESAGQKAGKGAVSGVFTGIITAPISIVSGLGQTILGSQNLSEDDRVFIGEKMKILWEGGKVGRSQKWRNPNSKLSGTVTLMSESGTPERPCKAFEVTVVKSGREIERGRAVVCSEPDGTYTVESGS
jgi:surface antigen